MLIDNPGKVLVHYVLQGVTEGFRIGFGYGKLHNKSVKSNTQVVVSYLQEEIALGRVVGLLPFGSIPGIQISPFGVITGVQHFCTKKQHQPIANSETSAVQYQEFYFDTISIRYFNHYLIIDIISIISYTKAWCKSVSYISILTSVCRQA